MPCANTLTHAQEFAATKKKKSFVSRRVIHKASTRSMYGIQKLNAISSTFFGEGFVVIGIKGPLVFLENTNLIIQSNYSKTYHNVIYVFFGGGGLCPLVRLILPLFFSYLGELQK